MMQTETTVQQGHRAGRVWFKWAPGGDTVLALATVLWMAGAYYATIHWLRPNLLAVVGVMAILTNLIVNVLLPVWWIAYHRRQPLSELGITTRRWLPSLLIGAGLALLFSFRLRAMATGIDWLPHLIFNAVLLWEPFFVFGWLQLRYDRAFGIVPGVLLAGLSFAAYHIGTYPPSGLLVLLVAGLIYATIFRLTSNLLILWPLVWAVGSSIGTLIGGAHFSWPQVAIWSAILLIQLAFIGYTLGRQKAGGVRSL